MQRLNAASCLLFAFLSAAVCPGAEPINVQVIQTHTGVRLASGALDGDPALSRCNGSSGRYSRELGFHCGDSALPTPPVNLSEYAFFYDVRVIMPDAARIVYHCSTILNDDCQGFPAFPENTSIVCSDFVFAGRAYKDCTASGSTAEGIGIYRAALHGDRMTIFGPHWRRNYLQYGTWQLESAAAQDPKPAAPQETKPDAVQDTKPAPPQETKPDAPQDAKQAPPQESKPDSAQDPKPGSQQETTPDAVQDAKPAPPQESKPDPAQETKPATPSDANSVSPAGTATAETKSDNPPPPLLSRSIVVEPLIDPRVIEQAKAGDQVAQYKLGYYYFLGNGVPIDYVQAAVWWRKAADQGYPDAQNNLGVLYNAGKGVPQSFAEAYFWQNLAAARASGNMQALFAKNRDESASKLWLLSRLKVQQRAAKWASDHPVAARAHEPPAEGKRSQYP